MDFVTLFNIVVSQSVITLEESVFKYIRIFSPNFKSNKFDSASNACSISSTIIFRPNFLWLMSLILGADLKEIIQFLCILLASFLQFWKYCEIRELTLKFF